VTDIKDLTLPTTTKEFAQWLRDIAEQVDRIPNHPIRLTEGDVEIGFYYSNLMFPQMPTGLHFQVDYASTELVPVPARQAAAAAARSTSRRCNVPGCGESGVCDDCRATGAR
jgi:hypothetical protein